MGDGANAADIGQEVRYTPDLWILWHIKTDNFFSLWTLEEETRVPRGNTLWHEENISQKPVDQNCLPWGDSVNHCTTIFIFFHLISNIPILFLFSCIRFCPFLKNDPHKNSSSFLSPLLVSLFSVVSLLSSSLPFPVFPVFLSDPFYSTQLSLTFIISALFHLWSFLKFHLLCFLLLCSNILTLLCRPLLAVSSSSSSPLLPSSPLSAPFLWWMMWVSVQSLTVIASVTVHSLWLLVLSLLPLPNFIGSLLRSMIQVCRRSERRVFVILVPEATGGLIPMQDTASGNGL